MSDIGCKADINLLKKGKSEEQCTWVLYKQRLIHLIKLVKHSGWLHVHTVKAGRAKVQVLHATWVEQDQKRIPHNAYNNSKSKRTK